ncbi:MAG: heme-degrading domain-containing protein [Chloroflexota bacterium]
MTSGPIPPNGPGIEELLEQERRLVLPAADPLTLHAIGTALYDAAVSRGLPLAVQVRSGERLVYAAAAPGSSAVNDRWATRKARVVHLFERSSLLVRRQHEQDGEDFHVKQQLPGDLYAPHGGAFPLRVANVGLIGSVVVSGLPQVEDHAFIIEILTAFLAAR